MFTRRNARLLFVLFFFLLLFGGGGGPLLVLVLEGNQKGTNHFKGSLVLRQTHVDSY